MKNLILVCLFLFVSGITLAQSKKEMIAILNNRVDSLNQIVSSERSDKQNLNIEISKIKSQIKELENTKDKLTNQKNTEISKLKSQIEELESTNDNITNRNNTEIYKLKGQIKELESTEFKITNQRNAKKEELQVAQLQMEELKKQLKIKQDSLVLVTTKLLNYKPAPPGGKLVVKKDIKGPIKTVTIPTIKTFKIMKQVWMKENLNVSTFQNGVVIPEVQDDDAWEKAGENAQPAWCYYDDDPNGDKYGKLYNWYAVIDNNGLCPQGWHVPSDDEWQSGFHGLPGGMDYWGALSDFVGKYGCWWSTSERDADRAYGSVKYDGFGGRDYTYTGLYNKNDALSVRCLRIAK
jgi:hypothetical protein